MTLAPTAAEVIGERHFDFYRCDRCGRLCTQPEMMRALGREGTGHVCPCGGLKYRPTNLRWFERSYPRVWTFAWQRAHDLGWLELRRRGQRAIDARLDTFMRGFMK